MGWREAQDWCNFVLLRPGWLPFGAEIESARIRPEAPPGRTGADDRERSPWTASNRSSHRCVIAAPGGRVRMKQFLYDWAPPAFDHPALWKSEVEPFAVESRIGWLGIDYRGQMAASLHARRTMVELSIERGSVPARDLVAICRGLQPVSDAAAARIGATSLAALSYAYRHEDSAVSVPVGYFRHHRSPRSLRLRACLPGDTPRELPGRATVGRLATRCPLDSLFLVEEAGAAVEADWVFRDPADPDTTLRLLVTRDGKHAIPFPPEAEPQPCRKATLTVGGTSVHHAWADERYGPHEAVWAQEGVVRMLLARPRTGASTEWFRRLLEDALL